MQPRAAEPGSGQGGAGEDPGSRLRARAPPGIRGRKAVEKDELNLFADILYSMLFLKGVTTVRRNLATQGLEVDNELVRETWYPVFRRSFLRQALGRCFDCRKGFWMYQQVHFALDCFLHWQIKWFLFVKQTRDVWLGWMDFYCLQDFSREIHPSVFYAKIKINL